MVDATAARRPALGWSDLAGSRVGLWGLGAEGAANLRRLRNLGVVPVLVDDRPQAPSFGGLPVVATASGGLEALCTCDAVVKSPGISRYRPEAEAVTAAGAELCGGLGLWMQEADRARVACITGTKGKSTTAALAGHLLRRLGHRCLVGGNIGRPPWDPEAGDDWDWWIVETSSFQATDLASSPPVVAVTSLAPDHLDWHGSVERYYRDKLSACTQPGAELTVADGASEELRSHAALLGPEVRWVDVGDPELDGPWVDGLGLPGRHCRRDALIARACLVALGVGEAADDAAMASALGGFRPLESRFHPIGTVAGVTFVDDSLSTNALPTIAALEVLVDRPVALLAGGLDRGIDYAPLARALVDRLVPTLVVTLPPNGARIHAAIDAARDGAAGAEPGAAGAAGSPASAPTRTAAGRGAAGLTVVDSPDLGAATATAFDWARPSGGVVLLSPAAPSFGEYRDYRHRAAVFAEAMRACAARGPGSWAADRSDAPHTGPR